MIHERAPFSAFDDRAKRVVEVARARAEGLRSEVVGPEHLLLALLAVRQGCAARAVESLAGSGTDAAQVIIAGLTPGMRPSPRHMSFTAACQEAIVRAAQQARLLGDDRIGTEHLLLGLLLSTDVPAVAALSGLGVDYAAARAEIARLRETG